MQRIAAALSIAAIVATSSGAGQSAERYQNESELRLVGSVAVFVQDAVKNNCLPRPKALQAEAATILRRAGITLLDDRITALPPGGYVLAIDATGFGDAGQCVASLSFEVYRFALTPEGHYAMVVAYRRSGVAAFGTSEMQDQLRSVASKNAADLANEILKARAQ